MSGKDSILPVRKQPVKETSLQKRCPSAGICPVLFLAALFLSFSANAQFITGTVIDKDTKAPIAGATILGSRGKIATNPDGKFSIVIQLPDTLTIRYVGYAELRVPIKALPSKNPTFSLTRGPVTLSEIVVSGAGSGYVADSLSYRSEFAKQFNFEFPKWSDTFAKSEKSGFRSGATGRGASILGLNAGGLISFLTRKKSKEYKFRERLLFDEEQRFIDHRFSAEWVSQVTHLKGDSLLLFLQKYRPAAFLARSWTEMDARLYIRDKFADFTSVKKPK